MKVYNTITKQKEEFIPVEEKKVKMYVCGPTVYDFIHIGNARPIVVFDTVRRFFIHKGYDVNFVSNFTDIDDKIIKKAIEEGVSSSVISEKYIKEVLIDMEKLNVLPAVKNPKVTEELKEIVEMITELIDKGYAYEVNGTVFFDAVSYESYGKLSKRNIDDLLSGARIEVNEEKKNSVDFVLWKPAKEGEPFWASPWGDGRPGWHIECSVMAKKYLGNTIDIHAGGEDLVFPHHENEIAQSECANGVTFANYWLHNGFINIDNQKMSKSKGNFFTIRDITERFQYNEVRFFLLSGHYRSPINFSSELMEASKKGLERIINGASNLQIAIENSNSKEVSPVIKEEIDKLLTSFDEKMEDDFNTADAISIVFDLIRYSNTLIAQGISKEEGKLLYDTLKIFTDVLGVKTENEATLKVDEEEILKLIDDRTNAKKDKNFQKADEIRNKLLDMGIVIEDTRNGVKWSIK
ncbi:MAG: cysteine--tRNA ligase [Lachnospirales bacterium]